MKQHCQRPRIGHTDVTRSFLLKKDVHCSLNTGQFLTQKSRSNTSSCRKYQRERSLCRTFNYIHNLIGLEKLSYVKKDDSVSSSIQFLFKIDEVESIPIAIFISAPTIPFMESPLYSTFVVEPLILLDLSRQI